MTSSTTERWRTEFATADAGTIRTWLSEAPGLVHERVQVPLKNGSVRHWGPLFAARDDLEKTRALVEAGADPHPFYGAVNPARVPFLPPAASFFERSKKDAKKSLLQRAFMGWAVAWLAGLCGV